MNLTDLNRRNIIEIGPGRGELTNEILKFKPKSLTLIEKDNDFAKYLKDLYSKKYVFLILMYLNLI